MMLFINILSVDTLSDILMYYLEQYSVLLEMIIVVKLDDDLWDATVGRTE
jgi:hypothetical protein